MRPRPLLDVVAGVVLVTVASAGFHRVFDGWTFLVRFGATAVVGAALVALLTRGLLARHWAAVALVLAAVPVLAYLALGDTLTAGVPTAETFSQMADGLTSGWSDALDAFLPLSDTSPVTVLLVALVYAASVITTALTLHTDRVIAVLLPSLVLYTISLPLSAASPESGIGHTIILIVALLGVLLLRANPPAGRSAVARADADFQPRRRLARLALIGGPMILIAGVLGLGVAAALDDDDPFDPRDRRSDTVDDQAAVNPLDEFKTITAIDPPEVDVELVVVGGGDPAAIDRVTLAVLDEYDGRVWRTTDRFEPYDEELPDDDALRDERETITVTIGAVGRDLGLYFPVVGRPVQLVDVSPVSFGDRSGTVLATDELGSAPVVQVVEIVVPTADDALTPDTGDAYDELRTLPPALSSVISDLVTELTADLTEPSDQLGALREHLETQTVFDADAPSGHAGGQIDAFLTEQVPGNEVHYATAMALMARAAGFPSRVVVGWRVDGLDQADADGVVAVSTAQYDVWAEVRAADGLGWQAVAVTPDDTGDVPTETAPGTTVPAGQIGGVRPSPFQAAPGQLLPEGEEQSGSISPWLILVALVALAIAWIVVFGILVVVAKRRRRRRRRRAPTPTERIQGAWHDSGDRLVERGVKVAPTLTLSETVAAGQVRLGDDTVEALRELVPEVGACAYGLEPPTSAAADRAWSLADHFRRDVRGSRSIVRTAMASVDPRPLLRENGRR